MKHRNLPAAMVALILAAPVTVTGAPGYLTDTPGSIVRNSAGGCWRTGFWKPEMAVVGCDGKLAEMLPPVTEARTVMPVVLDAETYFDFDQASLKPAALDKLDSLASEIKDRGNVKQVRITGHADRIGDSSYNQDLSQRRARSVSEYLLERRAVPEGRIDSKGVGERQPVVACEGVRGAALIECLAPNRRVVVEVVTTPEAQ